MIDSTTRVQWYLVCATAWRPNDDPGDVSYKPYHDMAIVSDDPVWWPIIKFCRLYSYNLAVCSVVVLYDWALTFEQEFELILRRRWTSMTVLYICVRYIGILYFAVNIMLLLPNTWITDVE